MNFLERYQKAAQDMTPYFYNHLLLTAMFVGGLILVFIGLAVNAYSIRNQYFRRLTGKGSNKRKSKWGSVLDAITSVYPLEIVKKEVKQNLAMGQLDEERVKLLSSFIILGLASLSLTNMILLRNIGQLWYVKILLMAISLFLPYYVLTLMFDLYKQNMNRHIPHLIDEFRSAFIKHRKVKPAMKECCDHIDNRLGKVVLKASEAPYIEESLSQLRESFNNIWFNIFVGLIINYKSNGGELIDQLYKLNKTMTRYNNIEKKKNKRLIWYELFAVAASVFSIPAIFWLNTAIMGKDAGVMIDAQSNIMISRIVAFSLLSLLVIRVLRKI